MASHPSPSKSSAKSVPPYRDASLPIERRVDDLLSRMTIEEKVGQLMQLPGNAAMPLATPEACREGRLGSVLSVVGSDVAPFQKAALESRLGIPLIVGIDAIHGHNMWQHATLFPSQLAMSNAWDEDLCRRIGRATAVEVAHTGIHWTFSPVFCLPRDLRWGRVGETFGEEPLLIGRLGAAMVQGYQGESLSDPMSIAACAKHYVGYGDSEGGRDASESFMTPRALRMSYLPPFERAIRAGCATVMSAYHAIDGTPVIYSRWLMTEVLRKEWGFQGFIVTDWDTIGRTHLARRVCATPAESAARALKAGTDMSMTTPSFYENTLANLKSGAVSEVEVDEACRRILRIKFRLGLFENPRLPDEEKARAVSGTPAHRALALESARRSLVLLKNRGLLPLNRDRVRRLAVIGPNADDVLGTVGDWALGAGQNQGQRETYPPESIVTVLEGLHRVAGPGVEVSYAAGCGMEHRRWDQRTITWSRHPFGDGVRESMPEKIAAAVRLAERSDVAVLVLGDHVHTYSGETKSTATLELPGEQAALFDAVVSTGVPVVVVLTATRPLAIPDIARRADAIVLAGALGSEAGVAVAEALFGEFNPSGKLTIGWPHHVGQQPVRYDLSVGAHQQAYPDLPDAGFEALFPFGFGLSYSTVSYRGLELKTPVVGEGGALEATVRVRNTGYVATDEIVQVYLRRHTASVTWPALKLADWTRVHLEPGAEQSVVIRLPREVLAICDAEACWVVEPGTCDLLVGPSSRPADLKALSFRIE